MSEIVYSHNGEDDWTSDYDEVRQRCIDGIDKEQITIAYYQGISVPCSHSNFIDGDDIVNYMQERAYDEYSEFAEDYLGDLPEVDKRKLGDLVLDFMKEKAKPPTFYSVSEVTEVTSSLEDDELAELNS